MFFDLTELASENSIPEKSSARMHPKLHMSIIVSYGNPDHKYPTISVRMHLSLITYGKHTELIHARGNVVGRI